jgi:hypothetical protein
MGSVSANTTAYSATGLLSGTTYWFRVTSYNDDGDSIFSNKASEITIEVPPAVPSGLTVGDATSSSLTLNWIDNSYNETGFKIYQQVNVRPSSWTLIDTIPANTTRYASIGLGSLIGYWYKISAYNNTGESAFSNSVLGRTLTDTPPPNAPSNINALNITQTSARISWTDNSDTETGFQIGTCSYVWSDGLGIFCYPWEFSVIGEVTANTTYKDISGLLPDTQYKYFVRSVNANGVSWSYGVIFTSGKGDTFTSSFYPIRDNAVLNSDSNSSVGNTAYPNNELVVGCDWDVGSPFTNSVCAQSLLQFNLSSLAGKFIHNATLRFQVNYAGAGDYPQNWHVWALTEPWDDNVTWNRVVVEDISHDILSEINGLEPITLNFPYNYFDLNVTEMVQLFADGVLNNYGFILGNDYYETQPDDSSSDMFSFYSNETNASKPELIVIYE